MTIRGLIANHKPHAARQRIIPYDFDTAVIGAGVIGLAVARRLAPAGAPVILLERHAVPGSETSSRNSEVIHAGLYYPPGSHRARLCVAGRLALYNYCDARRIAAPRVGKLVVATDPREEAALHAIAVRAAENGVTAAQLITGAQARALEPALRCTAALLSPDTGILDSHAYMLALQADAVAAGAVFAARTDIVAIHCMNPGFTLVAADNTRLHAARVVNAAGLGAVALAQRTEGLAAAHIPPSYLSKGSYFALSGRSPFRRLVYPVPIPGGAGVHLTLDLAGRARFGPDVQPVDSIDYNVDPARANAFYGAIRRYWPALPDGALTPAYAGIRPKIVPAAESQDFIIQGRAIHAIPGLVNLFGIESPGLTASLAIADDVAACLAADAA